MFKFLAEIFASQQAARSSEFDMALDKASPDSQFLRESRREAELLQELAALHGKVADLTVELAKAEMEGPKRNLEKANDAQAARAMSRNLKADFVAYQRGISSILSALDGLSKRNVITTKDIAKIQQLRADLRDQLRREL